ncbi:MAG: hypothetical protein KBE65_23070 [Phycisphaerae bacterium]|nr:hypothetical protein [Phycisphaerae bacterium]
MKAMRCGGTAKAAAMLLGTFGVLLMAAEQPDAALNGVAGLELLVNGDFEGPLTERGPSGWFKAVSSEGVETMIVEVRQAPQRGNVAFMELRGQKIHAANNWAQRVPTVPVGATVRVSADVKTENVPADTGFVMVQCWDGAKQLIGAGSSRSFGPIGGTEDWRRISFEFGVPPGTEAMILRCGLGRSGRIWFDNLSMKAISSASGSEGAFQGRGFRVTDTSLGQLKRVTVLGDDLAAYAQRQLGTEARVRREVFAQGDGQFQVVLSLDLSKSE